MFAIASLSILLIAFIAIGTWRALGAKDNLGEHNFAEATRRAGFWIVAAGFVTVCANTSLQLFADYLWHESIGYSAVWWSKFYPMLTVFGSVLVLTVAVQWLANGLISVWAKRPLMTSMRRIQVFVMVASVFAAVASASIWQESMANSAINAGASFGVVDPVFYLDWGYHMYSMHLWRGIQAILLWELLLALVVAVVNTLDWYQDLPSEYEWNSRGERREGAMALNLALTRFVFVLAGLFFVVSAWGAWQQKMFVLQGTVGLTTMNVVLPFLWVLLYFFLYLGFALIYAGLTTHKNDGIVEAIASGDLDTAWRKAQMLTGLVVIVFVVWVARYAAPPIYESFAVTPSRDRAEAPYAQLWLENTRAAFGLDGLQVVQSGYRDGIAGVDEEALSTLRGVDWPQVRDNAEADQELATWNSFPDADIDRYRCEGNQRVEQFYVAPREISRDQIPYQGDGLTFSQERLVYILSQGAVAVSVSEMTPQGLPTYSLKGLPVQGCPEDLIPDNALIAYGTTPRGFAIGGGLLQPTVVDDAGSQSSIEYLGSEGIKLSPFNKLLFALTEDELGILISQNITPDSRILLHRQVEERVSALLPMFWWDADPLFIGGGDQYYWLLDGYLSPAEGRGMPFVQAINGKSYMSHPIKALVGAFDGQVRFFVVDESDPAMKVWKQALPGVFEPLDSMPSWVQEHMRYPEGFFDVQSKALQEYHLNPADPESAALLINGREKFAEFTTTSGDGQIVSADARYKLESLPNSMGSGEQEFVITRGFTPLNAKPMTGWLVGRSDPGVFGQLVLFKFERTSEVSGAFAIEGRMNTDSQFSDYLGAQRLNNVILDGALIGNPIWIVDGDKPSAAFIWVKSYYATSKTIEKSLPRLMAVAISYNNGAGLAVGRNLQEALEMVNRGGGLSPMLGRSLQQAVSGATGEIPAPSAATMMPDTELSELTDFQVYQAMQACLHESDFTCFDRYFQELGARLSAE